LTSANKTPVRSLQIKQYIDQILNQATGQPIPGATVTVRVKNATPGTGALANIYSDDGVTLIAGSTVTADSSGTFNFYAPDGRYDLVASASGVSKTVGDVLIQDITEANSGDATTVTGTLNYTTALQHNGVAVQASDLSNGVTGSGAIVLATSPTLVTPVLGVATGTSLALGGGTPLTTTNRTGSGNLVLATSPALTGPDIGVATGTSLGLTSKIVTYNNIATASNGVATCFNSVDLTGQSASIGSTSIISGGASTGGFYLVTLVLACTTADASGASVTATIGWTGDSVARTFTTSGVAFASTSNAALISLPLFSDNSVNITYSTTVSGAPTTGRYSLHLRGVKV